jgi:signal transduction histidine kinase/CheY-like chemotaxis protein/HPt (histidine-containing phosphotransfer) domain-containing protein
MSDPQELLRQVAALTAERDQLEALARRQSVEINATRTTLVLAKRHLMAAEAARMAQWEWDITTGKVYLGARWDEMIGEEAENGFWDLRTLLSRVHPEDVAALRQALEDALSGKADRYIAEHRLAVGEGWIWIESMGVVTERDAQGKPTRLTGGNIDITARRKLQTDMEAARAQAEASNRTKSEFLANISHEVRTPLNAVLGLTRLLHQSALNTEQRQYLELIDSSATSLLALLNDILDLSKIEAGKLVFEQIRFDIAGWVREAVALHTPAAQKKGLKIQVVIAEDVPRKVAGDPGRLRQVISNLVSNAVKFTDRGGISVSVRLAPDQAGVQREQLRLVFSVRDSGVGIAADKQQQIFEAFTQADASTTRRYGGTGLGLAICARLVSMMAGSIHVASRPGEGSAFRFTAVFEQVADEMSVLTEPAPLEVMATQGLHVLLAEDHAVNELLMSKLLTQMGCTFKVARDGREAVHYWKTQRFDVVLMDVQMPVLSGFDAAGQIRAEEVARSPGARTPIVALTAHAMAGDREKCLAAGMDAYVSKPVSPALLMQAIREAMRAADSAPAADMLPGLDFNAVAGAPRARPQPQPQPEPPPDSRPFAPSGNAPQTVAIRQLVGIMGGDLHAVQRLAVLMRRDMGERRQALRLAAGQRDLKAARAQTHALKGSLSTICAFPAAEAAKHVENVLGADDWAAAIEAIHLLEQELERVDEVLAQLESPSD